MWYLSDGKLFSNGGEHSELPPIAKFVAIIDVTVALDFDGYMWRLFNKQKFHQINGVAGVINIWAPRPCEWVFLNNKNEFWTIKNDEWKCMPGAPPDIKKVTKNRILCEDGSLYFPIINTETTTPHRFDEFYEKYKDSEFQDITIDGTLDCSGKYVACSIQGWTLPDVAMVNDHFVIRDNGQVHYARTTKKVKWMPVLEVSEISHTLALKNTVMYVLYETGELIGYAESWVKRYALDADAISGQPIRARQLKSAK